MIMPHRTAQPGRKMSPMYGIPPPSGTAPHITISIRTKEMFTEYATGTRTTKSFYIRNGIQNRSFSVLSIKPENLENHQKNVTAEQAAPVIQHSPREFMGTVLVYFCSLLVLNRL